MTARRSTIQLFWHRLLTAVAFVLTTSLNLTAAPQSEGTRVAKDHGGQLEAAVKFKRDLPQSPSAKLDGADDGSPGKFAFITDFAFFPASGSDAGLVAPAEILIRPARLVRSGKSRAPPAI
ncbi:MULTISPECIES: hypothetical protein [Rhodomicrobium]|uniref:hypothetical protein n=1 Tax=Rhodomicrobium TaxID=1068 RepID=UPI000F73F6A4|nr:MULTISPECIES: hypothetical protein [Rhodomicrobium]